LSATILLTRSEVLRLLPLADCIAAVEDCFRAIGERRTLGPVVTGVRAGAGGFHIKAAGLQLQQGYFAAKLNANFPHNPTREGLPTIQGVIVLCDSEQGRPLGVFDSTAITALRTGAATAVAARLLARRDARAATIVGCGVQGRIQLHALALVRPLDCAFAYDLDPARAERFAAEASVGLGIPVTATRDLRGALARSQLCVTCTPSNSPLISRGDIVPGTFIAAVGADSEDKIEIHPAVMAESRVVPDLLEQALQIGDLHHAVAAGLMVATDIHAELGEVVSGLRPGRTAADEVFVFDSTGTALQDVAAAALVYQRALATGTGQTIDLAA